MVRELNTTSYAILGLLAMRDWSAYELTQEMQRNLVYFWPRAESAIYVEVKRLREAELATARVELTGRRRRTTYAITPTGRAALRAWLAEPAARGAQLESEALLRVFVAGALPPDAATVLGALDAVEREAAEMIDKALTVGKEFLDGVQPFQDQLLWRAHTHDFLVRYALLLTDWARETHTLVARWDEHGDDDVRDARALVADARARLQAATSQTDHQPTRGSPDDGA